LTKKLTFFLQFLNIQTSEANISVSYKLPYNSACNLSKKIIFSQKSELWLGIEILVNNQNVGQKSKFLVNNQNFGQKSKFW